MAQAAVVNGYNQMPYIDTALPKAGYPGANIAVGVTVANRGKTSIPAGTRVSYKVLQGATTVVAQGGTATIASDIVPGAIAGLNVPFTVPSIGNYIVRWDLQTGGSWWNLSYGTPVREQYFRGADWSVDWVTDNVPIGWTAGETKMISVTIANDGGRVWNAGAPSPVQLGYKWVSNATGNTFPGANRVSLPNDVQPGQTISLQIPVTAPVYPTNYTMSLDLYKQNEFAFADKGIADNDNSTGVSVDFKAAYTFNAMPQFTAGQTTTVPVTIRNIGNGTFPTTSSFPVNLGYHWTNSAGKTAVGDGLRTKLPADVPAGQLTQVQATLAFPSAPGTYLLRWDLVQEGISWFSGKGVKMPEQTVSVTPYIAPFYGGSLGVDQTPITMNAKSTTLVPVRIENMSNFDWVANVNLSYHWYDAAGNLLEWNGLRTPLAGTARTQIAALDAQIAVPATPGTYKLRYDIVQEGVTWFSGQGMQTPVKTITVVVPALSALYSAPATAIGAANSTITVPVTLTHAGTTTWQPGAFNASYHLYTQAGALFVWDGLRTALPAAVAPGQAVTLNVIVKMPPSTGSYVLRFDVVQEGVAWFSGQGVPTGSATLQVQ